MTKLEEVKRAICEAIPFGVDQADAAKAARAAIEAMRTPTEEMCEAMRRATSFDESEWHAAIDALLKEEGNG